MTVQTSKWQLTDNVAILHTPIFGCRIELTHPDRGLQDVRFGTQMLPKLRLLQIIPEPPAPSEGETLIESYVRGNDVVATYAQAPHRSARPQTYWRSLDQSAEAVGVELLVSMQTTLLESDPSVSVSSFIPSDQVFFSHGVGVDGFDGFRRAAADQEFTAASGLCLIRLAETDVSYCEMVFPSALRSVQVLRSGAETRVQYRLFPENLEKGVICRARIRGFVLARRDDQQRAADLYREMLTSLPPLTA